MKRSLLVAAAVYSIVLASSLQAGPVFDDLLNYPVVDQRCPAGNDTEGMGLAVQGKCQWTVLTRETPVGQTIKVGDNADKLWHICVGVCHWPDSWQQGEDVTFTLWDSPAKKKQLYTRTIDFDHKYYKWDVAYNVRIPTKPGATYYFELTLNGGGDNKINIASIPGDNYKDGEAYLAGKALPDTDLYFVTIVKPKGDRKANLERFLSQFDLDYPPLAEAKAAYQKGDLDGACLAILREFETRTSPDSIVPKPTPADKLDLTRANQLADENRLYKNPKEKDVWREINDQTTWREVWPNTWDGVRQNDLLWDLGRAYQTTGDEKYARKMNEIMYNWISDNTSPFDGGMRGAIWVAMHQAWRLGDAWEGLGAACKSKGLTDDVKLGWIDYWCHMANFAQKEQSGGNHANAVGEALMSFGHRFPEFRQAEEWKQFGFNKLVSNSLDLFREDGGCKEPTMNYHGFSLVNLLSGLDQARKYGYKIPPEINKTVERALVYTAYMMEPNGAIPALGDTDMEEFRPGQPVWDGWRKGEATKAYEMFGRKDCQWIATAGREGERPAESSYCFPQTGHYILRSDFGGQGGKDFDQARYLFFRAGYFGSHGHWDLNGFQMYAYGRPLIIDPGRTEYDSPLMPVLSSNTSHNVLLVDDQKMNRKSATINSWHTTPGMDLIDSTYEGLYTNVDHRRAIVFVRPDYYVMFDTPRGQEPHKMGINFWLSSPDVTIDRKGCSVHTNEANGSNVLVKSMSPEPVAKGVALAKIEVTDRRGSLDLGGVRNDIPVVTFWQNGAAPDFVTLMYPFPKGVKPRDMKTTAVYSEGGMVFVLDKGDALDYVFYKKEPGRAIFGTFFGIEGRAGVLRLAGKRLDVSSFALIDGTVFSTKDENLAEAETPVAELSVRYLPDAVEVTCPKPEPSLQIAALGRTKAVVNGKEMAVEGKTFRPF